MITKNNYLFIALLAILTVFFTSCMKDRLLDDELINTAQDEALASSLFDDAFDQADDAHKQKDDDLKNGPYKSVMVSVTCPTINFLHPDSSGYPRTIIVNFGDENCIGTGGRERRGKIIVKVTGQYREKNTKRTITFEDYHVNDNKVEGTKTVTNMGKNSDGNIYFNIKVENGKITTPEGKTIEWVAEREREWISGEDTKWNIWDDEYAITGGSDGVNSNGTKFTKTITSELIVQVGCRWIKKGAIDLDIEGKNKIIVDYGDGNCDNDATIDYNDKTYNIKLR